MIQIEQIRTGVIQENCYLVYNEEALLIIDPGAEGAKLIQEITRLGKKPAAILLTHTHYDHIGAVEELRHHYQIPVYVSPLEQAWLSNPILNLSGLGRHDDIANIIVQPAEHEFKLTDYEIGGIQLVASALSLMILLLLGMHCLKVVLVVPIYTLVICNNYYTALRPIYSLYQKNFLFIQAMVMPRPFNMKKPQTHFLIRDLFTI